MGVCSCILSRSFAVPKGPTCLYRLLFGHSRQCCAVWPLHAPELAACISGNSPPISSKAPMLLTVKLCGGRHATNLRAHCGRIAATVLSLCDAVSGAGACGLWQALTQQQQALSVCHTRGAACLGVSGLQQLITYAHLTMVFCLSLTRKAGCIC